MIGALRIFMAVSLLTLGIAAALTMDQGTLGGIRRMSPLSLIMATFLIALALALDALRFRLMAAAVSGSLSLRRALDAVLIGFFVSAVTPFCFGGGLIQVYLLTRSGVAMGHGVALCAVRALLDLLVFLAGIPILLHFGQHQETFRGFKAVGAFVLPIVLLGALLLLFTNPKRLLHWCERAIGVLDRRLGGRQGRGQRMMQWLRLRLLDFEEGIRLYLLHRKGVVAAAAILTIAITCLRFGIAPVLVSGLGGAVDLSQAFLSQFLLALLLYAAPTPGASGVAEGGFALLFAGAVPRDMLVICVFLWRFFTSYLSVGLGAIIAIDLFGTKGLKQLQAVLSSVARRRRSC